MKKSAAIPFQYLAYLGYRSVEWFIGLFPLGACMSFGSFVGGLIYRFAGRYRNLVRRNLTIAYEATRTPEEIEILTEEHFRALGKNMLGSARTSLMENDEIEKLVSYEGVENFQRGIDAGKGVVGALTHTANWELYARINPLGEQVPFGTIYQGLRNPFINQHIERRRGALGTSLFERKAGFRGPSEFLRNGGALGVLMDQFPGHRGVWAPFFGRLAATTTLPALLSLRTGAPIMFVGMYPDGEKKWKIKFHEPVFPPADKSRKDEWTLEIAAELNRKLTETVEGNPGEWFWVHNRFKTSGRDMFPHWFKFPIALPESTQELRTHYLLVRSPNPLGDACMSIPAVRALKNGRPDAHVTILCRENLEPLWRQQPEVDDIITMPGRVKPSVAGKLIRERRPFYDAAVLFPNSTSSALEARAGGVPVLFGYAGHHRKRFLRRVTKEPPSDPPTHHLERYLHIVEDLGADVSDRKNLLKLPPAPQPITAGQKQWKICLCPGAEFGEAKRWPLERFAAAVAQLRERHPEDEIHISIVGSPAEAALGEQLNNAIAEPKENLAGKTSVGELVDYLKTCHIVVSNDTGTMHLAAALGIPTVAIFGSTEPVLTSPIGEIHRVIREKVDCSPCFKRECPIDFRCMTGISVDQVVGEIEALMKG